MKVTDQKLSSEGERNFLWAKAHMGALTSLEEKYAKSKPLEGVRIGVCLHITKETSVLIDALLSAGAEVKLAAANPLSTQDDIAAYLSTRTEVWAWRGESAQEYSWCIDQVLRSRPQQIIDDGSDLHIAAHRSKARGIVGGSEETTTGVVRLKALEAEGGLAYPVIAVNDAKTKFMFDNRYGTGQSTLDGIMRATALLLAGIRTVVVGYGWVGKGVAMRARGMGARVTVVEVDPVRALEAHLDGFDVSSIEDAAAGGDLFVTATGMKGVIPYTAIEKMKEGAMLSNAGHFDVEIDVKTLLAKAKKMKEVRTNVDEVTLPSGKRVYLIAKGRIANLVAAEGHPPEVMQMSFANQMMAAIRIHADHAKMEKRVYGVPAELEDEVARAALKSMGISIGAMTKEQKAYAQSWEI
ncbi:MAG: adenosylhomocysteinase [Nitrososphaerota archaeon]|jgi:adenosylhomocysteinase|nr:adenosylhomocysteinase [Nitrososphaerota archaeon]MCL5672142.1 adenosylhomocysteinase [Nitrososphaerota archaeon]MDG6924426.1 adenosylhomocysteinase [Nitrososphaerota archaeon]MDG6941122.1 adenosylhomocysteinase [Nitrososphaerota archaeon]MDG6945707.1 adenosylhomocysteinase [Nitrososphaerota archaeon]